VERVRRTAVILVLLVIGVGAFQPYYLRVWSQDWRALGAYLTELPYRKVPGLLRVCREADRRIPIGARVLLVTPHRTWPGGYDYSFRRARYLLAGREMIPMLGPTPAQPPDFIVCAQMPCAPRANFRQIWGDASGSILEGVR